MTNKLESFLREYNMIAPGDRVICALSGGGDSVALTFALYLLKDKLGITLEAAHFNHHLRGEESERDEAFVRSFCDHYDIPLHLGGAEVQTGPKGLEASARAARYGFLRSLPGKVATAHTADDNAETVLMHLVRGTGLKGLGGITPVSGTVIRPMLLITRREVEAFLAEYALPHVEDSSNGSDAFLRNRVRHGIMPLLKAENPRISENLSRMALRLRLDEEYLSQELPQNPTVSQLRELHPSRRSRCLEKMLMESGFSEPEDPHIALMEALVFSDKPSARANFPGELVIGRNYEHLEVQGGEEPLSEQELTCPGILEFPQLGLRVVCTPAQEPKKKYDCFTVFPKGRILVGPRRSGDAIHLSGGTKSLKKWMIDHKIPAAQRMRIPVIRDDQGILGVYGIGADLDRLAGTLPAVELRFETI